MEVNILQIVLGTIIPSTLGGVLGFVTAKLKKSKNKTLQ